MNDKAVQMGSCNPRAEIVSSSVSSWPNEGYNWFKWEERKDGGVWGLAVGSGDGEDACSVKKEARGVDGLVSDAKTYADMMAAESRAACKHI